MTRTSKAAKLDMITALAKLVTLTLPEPCFIKAVTSDYVELYPSDTATVIKTGTATWARLYNGQA